MRYLNILLLLLILSSCEQEKDLTAQEVVDKAIEKAGGEKYENSEIQFRFRDISYSSRMKGGQFEFTRTLTDSLGEAKDILSNDGFKRFREGEEDDLHDTLKTKFANSVNSVHYFLQLPYGLNAPAVQKELVGEDEIEGEPYYEIKVTFTEEGGGEDHEDEYMYWIKKGDFTLDYLAYRFYVGDGGIRFRKAYNPRTVEGLRFVDYKNYKIDDWEHLELKELDDLYEAGELTLVSEINTEIKEVKVRE